MAVGGAAVGRPAGLGTADGLGPAELLATAELLGVGLGLVAALRGDDAIAAAGDDSVAAAVLVVVGAALGTSDPRAGGGDPAALPSRWLLVQPAATRPMITLTASTVVHPAGVSRRVPCARSATGSG